MFEKKTIVLYGGEFLLCMAVPTIAFEQGVNERKAELGKKVPYWAIDLISDEIQTRWRQNGMNTLVELFPTMLGPYKPELSPFERLEKEKEKRENEG